MTFHWNRVGENIRIADRVVYRVDPWTVYDDLFTYSRYTEFEWLGLDILLTERHRDTESVNKCVVLVDLAKVFYV